MNTSPRRFLRAKIRPFVAVVVFLVDAAIFCAFAQNAPIGEALWALGPAGTLYLVWDALTASSASPQRRLIK